MTTSVYTVFSDGTIDLKTTFLPQGVLPEIPRLGIAFCLAPAYDTLKIARSRFVPGSRVTVCDGYSRANVWLCFNSG